MHYAVKAAAVAAVVIASSPLAVQARGNTGANGAAGVNTSVGVGANVGTGAGVGVNAGTSGSMSANTSANASSNMNDRAEWNTENSYWRNHYKSRPYYSSTMGYSQYEPAYRYGVDLYNQNNDMSYNQLDQDQLRTGWNNARGDSDMDWDEAQDVTRDAYDRLYNERISGSASGRGSVSTGNNM